MNNIEKKIKPILFTFNLPQEGLNFINELVYTKIVEGNLNYSLTSAFMEGLILLQETYPNVPKRLSLKRRYYKGGAQKNKGKIHKTSIVSSLEINSWIEDYIVHKLKEDLFFSKTSFVNDLLRELEKKYSNKLLKIPNPNQ